VQSSDLDPALAPYAKVGGEVSGSLKCVGSDTMNNLVALWSEGFKKYYPSIREGIEGKGSSSAPPALCRRVWEGGDEQAETKPRGLSNHGLKGKYDNHLWFV
jgi:phosphate transport system substrate-binding protein